jgi:chemotaxis protein histidine kinase CheA
VASVFQSDSLGATVARELIDDISDHYKLCEHALIKLEHDTENISSLFRSVHTIKGNLGVVGFTPALSLINSAEEFWCYCDQATFAITL